MQYNILEKEVITVNPELHCFQQVKVIKAELLKKIESFGKMLPTNVLDDLIDRLGGVSKVAEVFKLFLMFNKLVFFIILISYILINIIKQDI